MRNAVQSAAVTLGVRPSVWWGSAEPCRTPSHWQGQTPEATWLPTTAYSPIQYDATGSCNTPSGLACTAHQFYLDPARQRMQHTVILPVRVPHTQLAPESLYTSFLCSMHIRQVRSLTLLHAALTAGTMGSLLLLLACTLEGISCAALLFLGGILLLGLLDICMDKEVGEEHQEDDALEEELCAGQARLVAVLDKQNPRGLRDVAEELDHL